ncbi:MAG: SUMF1/EgtB/PvdO family nonheme iron enzyme [Pseudomonadales bacterium]|nr:SUMF1/EgtB/PvdO family nonheme iron enzyme [Pseudomonadales bacterium]
MNNNAKIGLGVVAVVSLFWAYQFFGTATVAVTSDPTGAIVRVDGRQRGLTPIDRLELETGTHKLEVLHTHFAGHVEAIDLSRGDHLTRHIKFELGEGTFEFLSNPRGAWVEVDGERAPGRTPVKLTTSSGPHVIRMGQEERHIVEETHTLKHGENLEVNFNLNIDPHGTLTITTSPRSAKIEFVGEDYEYEPRMRIRMGEYAIRISRSGYASQEFRYKVRYGENFHQVSLQRQLADLRVRAKPAGAELLVIYDDGGRTQRKTYSQAMRIPTGRVEVRARAPGHRTEHKRITMGANGASVSFNLKAMQVKPGSIIQDALKRGGKGPEMVILPDGQFVMGDANGSLSEKPERTVVITQPFSMSKVEVTVADYLAFTGATGHPVHAKMDRDDPSHPANYVSFKDAEAYADWLSDQTGNKYRLPSEAEWEYAARSGTSTDYFFGNDPLDLCTYGNVADLSARKRYREWDVIGCDDGLVRPGPGGSYEPNTFGLYDMYGNVSEWVLDCGLTVYASAPSDGSPSEQGGCPSRGIRGGSWDSMAVEAKSAYRNAAASPNGDRGIRLVREL